MSEKNPVRKLNADVARKIAAGEVIDRPQAVVRELLDNAVDSGATEITVELTGGGIEKIRVVDNGSGMTRADLEACARPHSTSKIATETDLLNLSTLGFRGEALASIAAVARLSIMSGSYKMRASITDDHIIEHCQPVDGTIVEVAGVFENFPARRKFLKRPAAELAVCKNIFIEKSMARPDISFELVSDGNTLLSLPAGQTLKERFLEATGIRENESLFYALENSSGKGNDSSGNEDWSFHLIIGEPSVYRSNRKDIYIFVNGRRITEFSLVQAIEYGGSGYFPNGTFPVAALFVQMNPSLVDFNIHPAKREVRFHDSAPLHHGVSMAVKTFFHQHTVRTMLAGEEHDTSESENILFALDAQTQHQDRQSSNAQTKTSTPPSSSPSMPSSSNQYSKSMPSAYKKIFSSNQTSNTRYNISHTKDEVSEVADIAAQALETEQEYAAPTNNYSTDPNTSVPGVAFRFLGHALGTFLIAEKGNTLYAIDQHAAHERILYNRIMTHQGKRQNLLVPYIIETESEKDDEYLKNISEQLEAAGFSIDSKGCGNWEITAVPERWTGGEAETERAILSRRLPPEQIISNIAAMTACKAAVKDGYILDNQTAAMLAEAALNLPDPHCPHGRPVFAQFSRADLFALVRRTR